MRFLRIGLHFKVCSCINFTILLVQTNKSYWCKRQIPKISNATFESLFGSSEKLTNLILATIFYAYKLHAIVLVMRSYHAVLSSGDVLLRNFDCTGVFTLISSRSFAMLVLYMCKVFITSFSQVTPMVPKNNPHFNLRKTI